MARSRSDLDNETDHEIRRLTFPTSRRLAARSGIEPARRLKGRADALYRIGIVRGVAEEDSPPVCAPTKAKRPLQVTSGTWSSRLGLPIGAVPGIASVPVANAPVIRDHCTEAANHQSIEKTMSSDAGFIPYLVLIRFDRGDDLRDRLHESLSLLQEALAELGSVEPVMSSYDGSAVAYLLEARATIQPQQVVTQLQSPKSHRTSPLKTHDKLLVISVELGVATRMERITDWLREHDALA